MTELPQIDLGDPAKAKTPGWQGGKKADGTRTATVRCPKCLGIASLSGHTIGTDGTVSPSVVCPREDAGIACGWHVHLRLLGWKR